MKSLKPAAKILLVDDEPQILRVLRTALSTQGYSLRLAADGVEGVVAAAEWQPDLLITDLAMPQMDGVALTREVRASSQVPIIVLSVRNQDGTPTTDPNHQSNITVRTDGQISKNNHVNLVWWYNEQNRFFRRDGGYAFVSADASWRQIEPAYILQTEWTSNVHNWLFDSRFGYLHQVFPLGNQPGTSPTALNRQDSTLSTETGAPPYSFVNPANVISFAEGVSYYKPKFLGAGHNFKFGVDTSVNRNGYNYTVNNGINAIYNKWQADPGVRLQHPCQRPQRLSRDRALRAGLGHAPAQAHP